MSLEITPISSLDTRKSRIDKKHYYDDKELFEKVVEFILW